MISRKTDKYNSVSKRSTLCRMLGVVYLRNVVSFEFSFKEN